MTAKKIALLCGLSAAFVMIVYSLFWFWVAGIIRTELHDFMTQTEKNNVHIIAREMGISGYPGRHEIYFSGRVTADNHIVEIPALYVRSRFLPNTRVAIEMPEGASITTPLDPAIWSLTRAEATAMIPPQLPAALTHEDLEAWRNAGNTIAITEAVVEKDTLILSGSGTFMLDADLQPAGDFSVIVTGHMEFLSFLQQHGTVQTREALLATAIMSGLSKPDPETGAPTMSAPLSLQSRTLFVGPLRIAELPPVAWDWRNPPAPLQ